MERKTLIAIGASAGGVPALYDFFDNTLSDAVSYIITTHLFPSQKSVLCEMIEKYAAIEVCEVEDQMEIKPDNVYVMPENEVMSINGGRLILTKRDLSIKVNNAIDIFFDSLLKRDILILLPLFFPVWAKMVPMALPRFQKMEVSFSPGT
jgi:chemotaxis response regulator CheB